MAIVKWLNYLAILLFLIIAVVFSVPGFILGFFFNSLLKSFMAGMKFLNDTLDLIYKKIEITETPQEIKPQEIDEDDD